MIRRVFRRVLRLAPGAVGLALALPLSHPGSLGAQAIADARRVGVAQSIGRATLEPSPGRDGRPTWLVAATDPSSSSSLAVHRESDDFGTTDRSVQALIGVGTGALVGGFLGYFASQLTVSDWDQRPTAERSHLRQQFALSGAAIGAVAGFFARPKRLHVGRRPALTARAGRRLLASTDLRRSLATNALEAVELDRPEWLQALPKPFAVTAPDTSADVAARSVAVYLGQDRVGGVTTLRDVSLAEVAELRFYDPAEAEQKWGVEHKFGAIEVVPAADAPATTSAASVRTSPAPPRP